MKDNKFFAIDVTNVRQEFEAISSARYSKIRALHISSLLCVTHSSRGFQSVSERDRTPLLSCIMHNTMNIFTLLLLSFALSIAAQECNVTCKYGICSSGTCVCENEVQGVDCSESFADVLGDSYTGYQGKITSVDLTKSKLLHSFCLPFYSSLD